MVGYLVSGVSNTTVALQSARKGHTFVTSVVAASISRSSAVRSENPGKTCLACSLSSEETEREERLLGYVIRGVATDANEGKRLEDIWIRSRGKMKR